MTFLCLVLHKQLILKIFYTKNTQTQGNKYILFLQQKHVHAVHPNQHNVFTLTVKKLCCSLFHTSSTSQSMYYLAKQWEILLIVMKSINCYALHAISSELKGTSHLKKKTNMVLRNRKYLGRSPPFTSYSRSSGSACFQRWHPLLQNRNAHLLPFCLY